MKNEIEIKYKLPRDWEKTADISFVQLSDFITQLHDSAYTAAVKAVNRFATIRNYMIGFYIVEYEQHGSDRAKYGDKLLRRLAERVNKRGINETLLKVSRAFYLAYPQVKEYLLGKTAELIGNFEKSAMPSHQFKIPAEKLISQLSFSHIREILTVDNPLARFFLKDDEFKHSDLSQLNAYVSYFRENEMRDGDNPPVGILLCTKKGKKMVDYALAGLDNKLFVSSYMLSLPDEKVLEEFIIKETKG
ncbi:DUF1016 family protein [bacterium]|nr:DUF1016 family protein [bacterium]